MGDRQLLLSSASGDRRVRSGVSSVRPAVHADDPSSSHAAANTLVESGAYISQREDCLRALRLRPGSTARELAPFVDEKWGVKEVRVFMVRRRLVDLRRDGLVRRVANSGEELRWYANNGG